MQIIKIGHLRNLLAIAFICCISGSQQCLGQLPELEYPKAETTPEEGLLTIRITDGPDEETLVISVSSKSNAKIVYQKRDKISVLVDAKIGPEIINEFDYFRGLFERAEKITKKPGVPIEAPLTIDGVIVKDNAVTSFRYTLRYRVVFATLFNCWGRNNKTRQSQLLFKKVPDGFFEAFVTVNNSEDTAKNNFIPLVPHAVK